VEIIEIIFYGEKTNFLEVSEALGRFASNPELNFTEYNAACLRQQMRKHLDERKRQNSLKRFR
jgi:hypothetical protein